MDDLKRCYELFGLSIDASRKEIKQVYSDLAQIHHPDRFAHNRRLQKAAEEKFKAITSCRDKMIEALEASQSSEVPQNSSGFSTANTTAQASQPRPEKPRVELEPRSLQFQVTPGEHHWRKDLNREKDWNFIVVKNMDASTLPLEGRWEVAAHPNDPPHTPDAHAWISVTPNRFSRAGQEPVEFRVKIDTSKLRRLAVYERQLILHTNAVISEERVTIKVQTGDHLAFKQQDSPDTPYFALGILLLWSGLLGWLGARGDLSNLANFMASPLGELAIVFILPILCMGLVSSVLGALIGGLKSGLDMAKEWALGGLKVGVLVASNSHYGNSCDTNVLLCPNRLAETLIPPFKHLSENRVQAAESSTKTSK